jgi:DNA topoisomerase-1
LAIKKLETRITKDESNIYFILEILRKKDEGKQIALGTSKTNYNDPRISVAWCKRSEVRVEKVFPKTLLSKFLWAMYTDAEYEF